MKRTTYTVYALRDPRTRRVHYVGVTCYRLRSRLTNHMSTARADSYGGGNAKKNWIRGLIAAGLRPEIEQLEVVEDVFPRRAQHSFYGPAWHAEVRWIRAMLEAGEPLTNHVNREVIA